MSIKYTYQIVSIISDLRRGGGTLSHTSLLLNKLCNHKTINTVCIIVLTTLDIQYP